MGWPQSNQQTGFIGYPQNQLFSADDLRYMRDTQRQFLDYGNWQPGMTRTSQFMTDPIFNNEAQAPCSITSRGSSISTTSVSAHPLSSLNGRAIGSRWAGRFTGCYPAAARSHHEDEINPAPD